MKETTKENLTYLIGVAALLFGVGSLAKSAKPKVVEALVVSPEATPAEITEALAKPPTLVLKEETIRSAIATLRVAAERAKSVENKAEYERSAAELEEIMAIFQDNEEDAKSEIAEQ